MAVLTLLSNIYWWYSSTYFNESNIREFYNSYKTPKASSKNHGFKWIPIKSRETLQKSQMVAKGNNTSHNKLRTTFTKGLGLHRLPHQPKPYKISKSGSAPQFCCDLKGKGYIRMDFYTSVKLNLSLICYKMLCRWDNQNSKWEIHWNTSSDIKRILH